MRTEVDKLAFLRGLGADRLDMSVLPAERRRSLATMGRRLTPQALERRDPQRRYPILLTVLAQSGTDVLDEVVALFDHAISAKFGAAERRMQQELAERGKTGEDRQALLDDLLTILTDPALADEEIGALIRGRGSGGNASVRRSRRPNPGCRRFPTRGKSTTARPLSRYFANEGLSTCTHVTDQHATYGTKVIVATKREAHYVLDEILGNATDPPITEHATDTHGVTLVNFGLFDLLGMRLSPRIRDLGRITLYRPGPRGEAEARFPHAGPLMTRKANLALIAEHWDDLLKLAGSLKFGHATASLLVGKLSASGRQNTLAVALKEYGALRRTIYAAKYLSDPDYRRKISRQLNKGESLHALRRDLLCAHEG